MSESTRKARSPAEVPVGRVRAAVDDVLSPPSVDGSNGRREAVGEKVSVGSAEGNDLQLADREVSRFHLELSAGGQGIEVRDLGSTNGTWAGAVRIHRAVVASGTALRVGATTVVVGDGSPAVAELSTHERLGGLRGRSLAMRRLMTKIASAALSPAAVLVTGESGTGKELVARALHELGPRASQPFEVVDCGALVPTLVGSELFGHERGAFSGADARHVGAFERAHGGTLFLDEIGELPPAIQPALLGALERRRIRRLGGKQDAAIDVRVIAATHRDLRAEVNAGRFRLDLYYRLAVVSLATPPLRERLEDIPLLLEHFLRELGRSEPVAHFFSTEGIAQLEKRAFEGNVRELRNLVESLVAMGELPDAPSGEPDPGAAPVDERALPYRAARDAALAAFERTYLSALLARAGGNVSRAAREGSMDRSHLIDLLHKHGLR